MRIAGLLALVGLAGIAAAGDVPVITVEVGRTVERDVGYTRGGWMCDDASLVRAELVTRGTAPDDHNVWIVTGVKEGSTQCRVGYDLHRPSQVFDVRVVPAKSRR